MPLKMLAAAVEDVAEALALVDSQKREASIELKPLSAINDVLASLANRKDQAHVVLYFSGN